MVVHVGDPEERVQPATSDPEGSIQSRIEAMDGRTILGEGIVEFDGEATAAVCSGTQVQESVRVRPACPILPGHVQLPFWRGTQTDICVARVLLVVAASDLILEGEDLPIDAEGTDSVTYFG